MRVYNNIIIGSGPIGIHVFKKLKNNSLIISGVTKKKINSKNIHPKIKLKLKKDTKKIADLLYSKKNNFFLYTSAEIGGLTNYWGGQFFSYKKNENWPKKIFNNFSTYQKNISIINKMYPVIESKIIKQIKFNDFTINQLLPPIFKKKIVNEDELKKIAKDKLVNDRVVSFKKIKNNLIEIITENGIYICKKLILCSGPIGNAFILLRSFKGINYLKFKDDNPRMIFGLNIGKKKYLNNKRDKLLDFDIIKNNKLLAYTTVYNIDPNHFNKFLRPIISFFRNILRIFFFYGQFWISDEYNEIKLIKSNSKLYLSAQTINTKKNHVNIIKKLNKIGFRIFKILKLKYAYGFHYHCLKVNYKGKLFSVDQFLKKLKLKDNVYCFDSSVIEKIALKPPTKTYLATANYLLNKKLIK